MKILAMSNGSHKVTVLDYSMDNGFSINNNSIKEDAILSIYIILNGIPTWVNVNKFHNFINQWGSDVFK